MYSASGSESSAAAAGAAAAEMVLGVKVGKASATWPANQSRLSALSGPPQLFCTARVRAGHRARERATDCSKRDWRVSIVVVVGDVS